VRHPRKGGKEPHLRIRSSVPGGSSLRSPRPPVARR
jgi:hypothetical protein